MEKDSKQGGKDNIPAAGTAQKQTSPAGLENHVFDEGYIRQISTHTARAKLSLGRETFCLNEIEERRKALRQIVTLN